MPFTVQTEIYTITRDCNPPKKLLVGPLGLVPTSARLFIQPKDHKSASDFPG